MGAGVQLREEGWNEGTAEPELVTEDSGVGVGGSGAPGCVGIPEA